MRSRSYLRNAKAACDRIDRRRATTDAVEPVPAHVERTISDDLPRIQASDPRAIRLLRAEHPEGRPFDWRWVLVYEAGTLADAIWIASRQKYKTRVDVFNGKGFDNGKPMKVGPPLRHIITWDDVLLCAKGLTVDLRYDFEEGDLDRVLAAGEWTSELCPSCLLKTKPSREPLTDDGPERRC